MSGGAYRAVIEKALGSEGGLIRMLDGEKVDDLIWMIDILAFERAIALGVQISDELYEFGAAILCVLLRPLKPPGYKDDVKRVRSRFEGLSSDRSLRLAYRAALTDALLLAKDLKEVVGLWERGGISKVFALMDQTGERPPRRRR